MMTNGAPEFEVKLPENPEGGIVLAADFGLSESNEDCAAVLNKALEHCRETGAARLMLGSGTYKCFGPAGVVVRDLNNFTVDGQGAKLIFRRGSDHSNNLQYSITEDSANISISHCQQVEVRDLSLDWDWESDPLGAFVKVLDKHVDEEEGCSYFDVELVNYDRYPLYPHPVPVVVLTPMKDSLDGFSDRGSSMFFGGPEGHYGTKSEWLSPNRLRIYPNVIPTEAPHWDNYAYAYEDDASRNRRQVDGVVKVGGTYRLMHHYYGKNAFGMDSNEHLSLRDITIHSCRGMGMHVDGAQKYWQVENVNATPPKDVARKRPCTTTADVFHVARSRGFCKVLGCDFSLNQDDIFNFHDRTSFVKKVAATKVEVVGRRGMPYFGAQKADLIEFLHSDITPAGFLARVVSIDGNVMELDKTLPEPKGEGFLVANRSYETANILIKDCNFHSYYGRSIIIGKNITIENCEFIDGPSVPIRVVSLGYTMDKWSEGAGSSNVVIRNCLFDNNNLSAKASEGYLFEIFCGSRICPRSFFLKPSNSAINNILIEGNEFRNPNGLTVLVESGKNITFRKNLVHQPSGSSGCASYAGSILVKNGEGICIADNKYCRPDSLDETGH